MTEITIQRTGNRPLVFTGELLAVEPEEWPKGNRWHQLATYRTQGGKYVATCTLFTSWQGENTHYSAEICDSIDSCIDWFRNYPIDTGLAGYPDGEHYKAKQDRLIRQLKLNFDASLADLLQAVPEAAERID